MPMLLGLVTSRAGIIGILCALVLGVIGVQTLRLGHAKRDLTTARASLATAQASLKASEGLRASEYAKATSAVSDAETACSARVQAALKSGAKIHVLVNKPVAVDPKTNCPLRQLIGAGELRDALQGH